MKRRWQPRVGDIVFVLKPIRHVGFGVLRGYNAGMTYPYAVARNGGGVFGFTLLELRPATPEEEAAWRLGGGG